MEREAPIFVAGRDEFVGGALERRLRTLGFENLVGAEAGPDLRDPSSVSGFFAAARPRYVFLTAGRTGGIASNQLHPADLMLDNLAVETAVVGAAHRHGAAKLLYLASACIYPRECPQPMRPEFLLTAPVEPTSQSYALAKLAGLELCRAFARQYGSRFVTAIPANVFGPGDDDSPEDAHVVGALMHRMQHAKLRGDAEVVVWGSGNARRDFLYVDDLADACVFLMQHYEGPEPINVSGASDVPIRKLAADVQKAVGFEGRLRFDPSLPDGAPVKVLDAEPLRRLGWSPSTPLDEALAATYRWLDAHGSPGVARDA